METAETQCSLIRGVVTQYLKCSSPKLHFHFCTHRHAGAGRQAALGSSQPVLREGSHSKSHDVLSPCLRNPRLSPVPSPHVGTAHPALIHFHSSCCFSSFPGQCGLQCPWQKLHPLDTTCTPIIPPDLPGGSQLSQTTG